MDFNEEKFQAHLKEIVSAGEAIGERPLTLSELGELANSMGLSDSDWERLLQSANDNLVLAKNHLQARNYVDAVDTADKATAINPYIKDGNSVLAQAYLMQWIDDQDAVKLKKAEFFARKELIVDPQDKEALKVLSTVQNKKRISSNDNQLKKKIFKGLGVLLIIALIGYFLFGSASSGHTKNKLIELEEEASAKYELVNTAISRRNNLVPELLKAVGTSSNSVSHEITDLQNKITDANGKHRIQLELKLEKKINQAKGLVMSNTNKSSLIISIEGAENRISFARTEYNQAVKNFNVMVKQHIDEYPDFETKPYFK